MPAPTLLDYLHQLHKQGLSHVEVDDSARKVLRELYTRGSARRPTTPTPQAPHASTTPSTEPAVALTPPTTTGHTPAEKIASLANLANTWAPSKNLQTLRDTLVFSIGNPQADLMLVGEAPSYHDEQQRQPFVGPSGTKLDQILKAMGLSREQVYITNICKFRPATKNQTTNNRPPSPEEMATSLPFLKAEIDVVKPRVILALGPNTAHALLNSDQKLPALRNSWHQFQGVPLRITYHPSYLLQPDDGLGEKRKVWEDMLAAMEKLGLPISEKQRGYFK